MRSIFAFVLAAALLAVSAAPAEAARHRYDHRGGRSWSGSRGGSSWYQFRGGYYNRMWDTYGTPIKSGSNALRVRPWRGTYSDRMFAKYGTDVKSGSNESRRGGFSTGEHYVSRTECVETLLAPAQYVEAPPAPTTAVSVSFTRTSGNCGGRATAVDVAVFYSSD